MPRFFWLVGPLAALLLGGCAVNRNADTNYVARRYDSLWTQRATQYAGRVSRDKRALDERTRDFRAVTARPDLSIDDLRKARIAALTAISALSKSKGRAFVLKLFNAYRTTAPTLGMFDAWFAGRADRLKAANLSSRQKWKSWKARIAGDPAGYRAWWADLIRLVAAQGLIDGAIDEMVRIHREMVGYVSDYARASRADQVRRQRTAAAMRQLGAQLQQQAYRQQMLSQMNRPRTCTTLGSSVTCY